MSMLTDLKQSGLASESNSGVSGFFFKKLGPTWKIRAVGGLAGIGLLALFSKILLTAAIGGASLLLLGIIAVAGIMGYMSLDLVFQKWENHLLKKQLEEAAANPREQLHRRVASESERLSAIGKVLSMVAGRIRTMETRLKQRKQERPGVDYSDQEKDIAKMWDFHLASTQDLTAALAALKNYKEHVEDEIFKYEFAQDGAAALDLLDPLQAKRLREDLLANESLKAISLQYNTVMSSLDSKMMTLSSNKSLAFGSAVIDVSDIRVSSKSEPLTI